jgi:transcriptional regulator with XRE-family HTH domain
MNDSFIMVYQTTNQDTRTLLAGNLRRLRIARHLSLSELARATSMSKATLSGIEHGRANPTVDTLVCLAGALGVSIAELLTQAPMQEMHIVRGRQADPPAADRVGLSALETVKLNGKLELWKLSLPAGHVYEVDPQANGSRRGILVLQGKLIAGPVQRISELVAGDYASSPADVAHVYEAGRGFARALVLAYCLT